MYIYIICSNKRKRIRLYEYLKLYKEILFKQNYSNSSHSFDVGSSSRLLEMIS